MARKSRKIINLEVESLNFKVGIYARLSSEKGESLSIENQILYCKEYINNDILLDLVDVYVDNGVSGTMFDRPDFNRLMADIKDEKINCVIVKDISRFGRSYIEVGTYIDRIFPDLGVRFIAINENYDNFNNLSDNEELSLPLKNMINDLYAKDISKKISTSVQEKMQNGTYKRSKIPYGYKLNENGNMIVDDEYAVYIQMIFKWKIDGVTLNEIISNLNNMKIPSPTTKNKGIEKLWVKGSLSTILKNQTYVGDTVWGKNKVAYYKGEEQHKVNSNDWFIFENTHEPIISREDFNFVQDMISKSSLEFNRKSNLSKAERDKFVDLFQGKIFCSDCLKKLYLLKNNSSGKGWNTYYMCSSYSVNNSVCSSHYIKQKVLENHILQSIKFKIKLGVEYEKLMSDFKNSEFSKGMKKDYSKKINDLKLKRNDIKSNIKKLYNDLRNDILTENEYLFIKKSFVTELEEVNLLIEKSESENREFEYILSTENYWINAVKSISNTDKLTEQLVNAFIEKIIIYDDKKIEIVYKYNDIY